MTTGHPLLMAKPASAPTAPDAETFACQEQAIPSRILPMLCEQIEGRERLVILDLGAALGSTVTFLSRYRPRVYFADLFSCELFVNPAEGVGVDDAKRLIDERLGLPAGVTLDACLFWDALHCTALPVLNGLISALRPYIRNDTIGYGFGTLASQWLTHSRYGIRARNEIVARPDMQHSRFHARSRQQLREHFAYLTIEREAILREGRLEMLLGVR